MASIMRFDQWQNSLGQNYGTILQVVEYHSTSAVAISSTNSAKLHEASITLKSPNSAVLVMVSVGRSSYNQDIDMGLAMGYATSSSSASTNYTSLHGSSYNRELVTGLGSFWAQDTSEPGGGNWNGGYNISGITFNKKHSPNVPAGTTLYYSLWGSSDGTFYVGRSWSGSTDNGYDTSIILMEVAQ